MASGRNLETLDVELLALILEYVDDESPQSTKSVALVSKYINSMTKLVAHRRKDVVFNDDFKATNDMLQKWVEDDQILRRVHHLTIRGAPRLRATPGFFVDEDEDEDEEHEIDLEGQNTEIGASVLSVEPISQWQPLANFIAKLGQLTTIIWNYAGPIPLEVIEAIHIHPRAELKLYQFLRASDLNTNDPAEVALARSPALTSFRARIRTELSFTMFNDLPNNHETAALRIIATAPNLKHASIIIDRPGLVNKGVFAPKKPNSSLKSLFLDGYPISEDTLKAWSTFIDLSKLEVFKCTRGHPNTAYFQNASHYLANLKQLSLNLFWLTGHRGHPQTRAAVEQYIRSCAPLEQLSLWSWVDIIPLATILTKHGSTLKALELRERETPHFPLRKVLSAEEITEIRNACPNLIDFTLDSNRKDSCLGVETEEDNTIRYEEIKKMNLEKLQIYYDIGETYLGSPYAFLSDDATLNDSEEEDGEEEEVNADAGAIFAQMQPPRRSKNRKPSTDEQIREHIQRVWKIIFAHRTTGPRSLDVKFGEWERRIPMFDAGSVRMGSESNRSWWIVRPQERDDCRNECRIVDKRMKSWRDLNDLFV